MKKIFILVLLIGIALSKLRSTVSPCASMEPNSPGDCFSQKTEFFQQTCCYFYGTYKNLDGETVTGPACLEAYRKDVSTGARKSETQKKIEAGTYWENYPAITNIESFLCFDEISECEKQQPAKGEDDCFNSHPELNSETCCYLESDWHKDDRHEDEIKKSCVDIYTADVQTEEGIEEVKEKIKNGTYWTDDDYGYAKKINAFKCKKSQSVLAQVPIASSNYLINNLLILAFVLFLF